MKKIAKKILLLLIKKTTNNPPPPPSGPLMIKEDGTVMITEANLQMIKEG